MAQTSGADSAGLAPSVPHTLVQDLFATGPRLVDPGNFMSCLYMACCFLCMLPVFCLGFAVTFSGGNQVENAHSFLAGVTFHRGAFQSFAL